MDHEDTLESYLVTLKFYLNSGKGLGTSTVSGSHFENQRYSGFQGPVSYQDGSVL